MTRGWWEYILDLADFLGVLELRALLLEALLGVVVAAVLDGTVLYRRHLVGVLLREDLLVLDGLDGGVVVLRAVLVRAGVDEVGSPWQVSYVLVDLAVDGGLLLIVLRSADVLVLHGGVGGLVNRGVLGSVLVEETLNS